jgi:hypothetical protein
MGNTPLPLWEKTDARFTIAPNCHTNASSAKSALTPEWKKLPFF